jgi:hypothetical protein
MTAVDHTERHGAIAALGGVEQRGFGGRRDDRDAADRHRCREHIERTAWSPPPGPHHRCSQRAAQHVNSVQHCLHSEFCILHF